MELTIKRIDKMIELLEERADRCYDIPEERDKIWVEVNRLMDQRDELVAKQIQENKLKKMEEN